MHTHDEASYFDHHDERYDVVTISRGTMKHLILHHHDG